MINGVSIPVLTPFKFYPASAVTGDGINFQNIDNTELYEQDWEGVYPNRWVQPVARQWNDLSYGLDFQVYLDSSILAFASLKAAIIDTDGAISQALDTDDFFTYSGTLKQIRIFASELSVSDGCYRIKIYENGGDDIYYSELINISDTHDDCYPFEYSNFENDFGLIFENATAETWAGKVLIPMREYKPIPADERESYVNDPGKVETLRVTLQRKYEFESDAVATWFTELVIMGFGCSVLKLNKNIVNVETAPESEIVSETDKMEIRGEVFLNEFVDNYHQDAELGTITELLSSWTPDSVNVTGWFLGSRDTILEMHTALHLFGVGNFSGIYWSSSEETATTAWNVSFTSGVAIGVSKGFSRNVRACRIFSAAIGAYSLRDVGPAGGLIFWTDGAGNYLEAAPSDQSASTWADDTTTLLGASGTAIGTGASNTGVIIGQTTTSAAKVCDDLTIVASWATFTASGKNITSAIYTNGGTGTAYSNNFSITTDEYYLINIEITGTIINGEFEIDGDDYSLATGTNIVVYKATSTGTVNIDIASDQGSNFSAVCSVKNIV